MLVREDGGVTISKVDVFMVVSKFVEVFIINIKNKKCIEPVIG